MKVGVDAGGTKTVAVCFNGKDAVQRYETGMGNSLVNYDQALANMVQAVKGAAKGYVDDVQDIEYGTIGAAGSSSQKEQLTQDLQRELGCPIYLGTDVEMSHVASFADQDGALLIAGTGSVLLVRKQGVFDQYGGWGHLLGDEGSAYWIAKQMTLAYLPYLEVQTEWGNIDPLIQSLHDRLPDRASVIDLFYNSSKTEVAALAVMLEQYPDSPLAKKLSKQAAQSLANLLVRAYGTKNQIVLSIEGSVICKNKQILADLTSELEAIFEQGVEIRQAVSATQAACVIGR